MAIPEYQTVTLPLLRLAAKTPLLRLSDALETLSEHFGLTQQEREERVASGRSKMNSRVQWAATYLAQAKCVSRPQPSSIAITDRGKALLATAPKRIDYTLLRQHPEFVAFMDGTKPGIAGPFPLLQSAIQTHPPTI